MTPPHPGITEVWRLLEEVREVLYGNGSEGIKTRMTKIEMAVESMQQSRTEMKRAMYVVVVSVILSLLGIIGTGMVQYVQDRERVKIDRQDIQELKDAITKQVTSTGRP